MLDTNQNPDLFIKDPGNSILSNTEDQNMDRHNYFDLYDTNYPDLNVRIGGFFISDTTAPPPFVFPNEVYMGQYDQVNDFDFSQNHLGNDITNIAFAIVARDFPHLDVNNVNHQLAFTVSVTDPRDNKEIANSLIKKIENNMGDLWIQSGANAMQGWYLSRYDCRAETLGIDEIVVRPLDAANASLLKIDNALEILNGYRANAGTEQNRLEYSTSNLGVAFTSLEDANSRISDADMAKEMMALTKYNIIQQAAPAMLAQARQQPESVLILLRT
jgi:flagellin-like hook-associated protein FlgL